MAKNLLIYFITLVFSELIIINKNVICDNNNNNYLLLLNLNIYFQHIKIY